MMATTLLVISIVLVATAVVLNLRNHNKLVNSVNELVDDYNVVVDDLGEAHEQRGILEDELKKLGDLHNTLVEKHEITDANLDRVRTVINNISLEYGEMTNTNTRARAILVVEFNKLWKRVEGQA